MHNLFTSTGQAGRASMRVLAPAAVLVCAALLAIVIVTSKPALEKQAISITPLSVWVEIAKPGQSSLEIASEGLVKPQKQIDLAAEVSGKVSWISDNLVSGGRFNKGDILLHIDDSDFQLELQRTLADRQRAVVEREIAEKNHRRQRGLHSKGIISDSMLDDALKSFKLAEAAEQNAIAMHEQALLHLARTKIAAPFGGRVQHESVDIGQYVTVGSKIASLYADDTVEVRLPITNSDMRYLNWSSSVPGALSEQATIPVAITGSYGGASFTWQGSLARVESEVDASTRLFYAVAKIVNPTTGDTPPLAVGLYVDAIIQGVTLDNIVAIPRSALKEDDKVLLVGDDNTLHYRDVSVLRIEKDRVLIDDGINAGEKICVSPLTVVVEGMLVNPVIAGT